MAGKGDKPRPVEISYEEFGDRWDDIFKKKRTPAEWCTLKEVVILDPDGWRVDGKDWNKKITEKEFDERLYSCTVRLKDRKS